MKPGEHMKLKDTWSCEAAVQLTTPPPPRQQIFPNKQLKHVAVS